MGRNRGKTYELKARFTAEADVSAVEQLENRIDKLNKRLNALDKANAKVTIKQEGVDSLEETSRKAKDNLDEIGTRKRRKPRVDDSEVDKTASKLERLTKLVKSLDSTKVTPGVDSSRIDMLNKKIKSAQKQAFDIEYEAKLTGDDTMRRQAQKLQQDLNKTLSNVEFVKTYQNAQKEMLKSQRQRVKAEQAAQAKAQGEQDKAFAKGMAERTKAHREMEKDFIKREQAMGKMQERAAREMGAHFAKQAKAVKNEMRSLDASISNAFDKQRRMELTLDAGQALGQARALDNSLKNLMERTYKLSITADNTELKTKATESYRILQGLSKQVANARVGLQNEVDVNAGIDRIQRNLTELSTRPWEFEISGDATEARATIASIAAQARAQFSKAYELEIRAETQGFPEAAQKARDLRQEALQLAQTRARLAVELDGVPQVLSGLFTVKRAAEGVEGNYEVRLDTDKIKSAATNFFTIRGAASAARGAIMSVGSSMANAQNAAITLSRGVFVAQQVLQAFTLALVAVGVVSAGPLVAGLMIAVGAVGALGAALGLIAGVAAPVISSLTNFKENSEKAASAANTLRNANVSLAQAEQGVVKANQQVATTARQNAQAVSGAIKAHEDAVRGVDAARRQYGEAVQGVHDAEVQGEEQVQNAVEAHAQAVRGIEDAQRAVGKTAQAISDAQVQAQEQVQQATRAHEMAVRSVDNAQRQYVQSQRAVTDAQYQYVQAQRAVTNAQQEYTQAQRASEDAQYQLLQSQRATENAQIDYKLSAEASADAQKELTFATEDYNDALATEQQRLLGLNYDLEGLQLNQRQLALDMQEARQQMGEADTPLAAQQAALRLEELQLRQKEGTLAIEEAQRRLSDAQTEGTGELQSAYDQQQNASRGVRDALRQQGDAAYGVQDAMRQQQDAAYGVQDAERGIQDASYGIEEAQKGLQDAAYGVEDAFYAQEQAALGVQDAQYEVTRTAAEVQKAQQNGNRGIAEALEAHQLAQRDLNDAVAEEAKARLGVGKAQDQASRGVLDAQKRVMEAQLGVDDSLRREQEAREGITEAQISASENMRNALQGVEDANMRLKDAQDQATEAQKKYNEAMENVPSEKVAALHDAGIALWDRWKRDTAVAQEALVDFGIELMALGNQAMPALSGAAVNSTFSMIEAFNKVKDAWADNGALNSFVIILRDIPGIARNMGEAFGYTFGALANVFAVMMPFVQQFSRYLRDISLRFLEWTNSAEGRMQIYKFFAIAGPVAKALGGFIWRIGGALLSWSVNHPNEVLTVLNGILWVLESVLTFIAWVVRGFAQLHAVAPGLTYLSAIIGGIAFGILLIPRSIRQVLFFLAKMALGFGTAGMAGATMGSRIIFALGMIGKMLGVAGGAFLVLNGIATGSMWQIAAGIGMVAMALGMGIVKSGMLAGGAFLLLNGVATDSMWQIAAGVFMLMNVMGMKLMPSVFLAAGAFLTLSGGGLSALDILALAVLGFAAFMPKVFWQVVQWIGRVAIMGFLVPAFTTAFGAIAGIVAAGAAAMGVPIGTFVVGAVAVIGLFVVAVITAFDHIVNFLSPMFAGLWQMWNDGTITGGQFMIASVRGIAAAVFSIFATVLGAIPKLIANALSLLPGGIGSYFARQSQAITDNISRMREAIAGQTAMMGVDIGRNLGYGAQQGMGTMSRMGESIKGTIGNMVGSVRGAMGSMTGNIIDTSGLSNSAATQNMSSLAQNASGSLGGLAASGSESMQGLENSIVNDTYGSYQSGAANIGAMQSALTQEMSTAEMNSQASMAALNQGVGTNTYDAWSQGAYNTGGLQGDITSEMNTADLNTMASFTNLAQQGVGQNSWDAWSMGDEYMTGLQNDTSYQTNLADINGSGSMAHLSEEGVGVNLDNAWGYADTSTLGLQTDASENIKGAADYGSAATGEWGSNMAYNINEGVKAMLSYMGTDLIAGVNSVMSKLGMDEFIDTESPITGGLPTSWKDFVLGGTGIQGYAEGGMSPNYYMANGGSRGGVGTSSKNPQHITWNEQNGNEAWVAQKGPKQANLGYLSQAASWFDMSVVPMAEGGMMYMEDGGGLGPTTYDFTPEVAQHAKEVSDAVGGGVSYNTYTNHPVGYEERAPYSVDFWGPGGRGDSLQNYSWGPSTGDKIVSLAQQYPDFSYFIWAGEDSIGGAGAATDAHYDHVHITWMGDLGLGGGLSGSRIASAISELMPTPPDLGDNMIANTIEAAGQNVYDQAKTNLMSRATTGAGLGTELDLNVVGSNLEIGEQLAAQVGWTGSEWEALKELWTRESGWSETADNPTSDAYGIAQMMTNLYDVPSDPAGQIAAGIDYIMDRYTTPSAALAHHDQMNWYQEGGIIGGADPTMVMGDVAAQLAQPAWDNAEQLAQMIQPAATYTGWGNVAGRVTSIPGETSANSAYFNGPNGEGMGAFYGDDAVASLGEAAAAQTAFSYWFHKGRSNLPQFNTGQDLASDDLKVVWAGSTTTPTTPTTPPTSMQPTTIPTTTTQPMQATGYTGGPYASAGGVEAYGSQVATASNRIVNGQVVSEQSSGTGMQPLNPTQQPTTMQQQQPGMSVYTYDASGSAHGLDIEAAAQEWLAAGVQWMPAAPGEAQWTIVDGVTGGYGGMTSLDGTNIITLDSEGGYGGIATAVHELGHAMGLPHTGETSIMNTDMVYDVQLQTGKFVQPYDIQSLGAVPAEPTSYYRRGGVGTQSKNAQNVVWNEGAGNEAWIAQNGPKHKNVGYLQRAASWFDMGVVPMREGGYISGVGEALGPTHYEWSPEVQGYVDYLTGTYGASANTYVGHGNPGGSTEDMTADFWGGDRGVPIDPGVGDQISQAVLAAGGLAYMIWNGSYYGSDGSAIPWPEDPHYDHVHVSWAGGAQFPTGMETGTVAPLEAGTATPLPATMPTTGTAMPATTTPTTGGYGATSVPTMPTGGGGTSMPTSENSNVCSNVQTLSENQGIMNDNMGTLSDNQSQLAGGMGGGGGSSPFTANTDNVQSSGPGAKQSSTSGAITQNLGTGMDKMANDAAQGIPGVASGVQGMNTDMNSGLSGIDAGIGELNSTMGSMCDPSAGLGNPAIGGTNTAGGNTASNVATNQAVDSYTDTQNTGQATGGGNLMVGGKTMGAMGSGNTGISPDTELLGGKMDDLTEATYNANEETELGKDSLEEIVRGAVAAALGVISSKGGRDIIDENLAGKMDFDKTMKGL